MPTLAQYRLECRRLLHDATGKFWSNSELDDYLNDARLRVCSDTGCLRRLVVSALTASREQYAIGSVMSSTIVDGGTGYVTPTLIFSGTSTSPAVATATVASGVITAVTFSSYGEGYIDAPTITIVEGSPSQVSSLTITNAGEGYLTLPTLVFSGGGGTGAAGNVALAALTMGPFVSGTGYQVGDEMTLVGGTYTRPATIRATSVGFAGNLNAAQVIDGGEYTVLPGTPGVVGGTNTTSNIAVLGGHGSGATVYIIWGIGVADVTASGSGYATAPGVVVTGGSPAPTTATVTAVLGGGGSGAEITVTVLPGNTLDILNITPIWGNQRVPLRYMPFTEFNARMRTWIPNPQRPVVWSRYGTSGATAFIQPVPDQNYVTEFDTCITPEPLATDDEADIIQYPYTSPVAYYACWKAKLKQQSYSEGEIFLADYKRKILEAQASVQMRRIPNPYYGYTGA